VFKTSGRHPFSSPSCLLKNKTFSETPLLQAVGGEVIMRLLYTAVLMKIYICCDATLCWWANGSQWMEYHNIYDPSKCLELLCQQHSIISQKSWILMKFPCSVQGPIYSHSQCVNLNLPSGPSEPNSLHMLFVSRLEQGHLW